MLTVVGKSGPVVGSSGDTGFCVVVGVTLEVVDVSEVVVCVVLSDVDTAVEVETRATVVSVIITSGDAAVEVVTLGRSEAVVSCMDTLFVVVLQSVATGEGTDVVVRATWSTAVGNSEAVVEEVVISVEVMCGIFSVIEDGAVPSGITTGVILLVVKGGTGVTDFVVSAEMIVGKDVVPVLLSGEV